MNMHIEHAWPDKASTVPTGMLVSVVTLRKLGVRINRQDMHDASPTVGRLVYEEAPKSGSGMIQHDRTANLYHRDATSKGRVLPPLFDPFVVKWDDSGIVVRGYEINSEGMIARQHVQVWLVRPQAPA